MNRKTLLLFLFFSVFIFSGCSGAGEVKKEAEKPMEDASGYVPGMVDIKNKAQSDVNEAVEKENDKINNALSESDMETTNDLAKKYSMAVLKTNLGSIKVKFYSEESPKTVENFLKLSNEKFYDGTKFHRVIKDFMIQGGDPLSKDEAMKERWGTGGPGYKFNDEINSKKLVKGSLAMANSGPNTNGSQFFIVTADATPWLDGKHTNFGEVVSGLDVVMKIGGVETGASDRPVQNVVLESVELLEK